MRGFCRDLVVNFAVDFSVDFVSFDVVEKKEGPKKSTEKIQTKIHDQIHALGMKIYHDECSAEGQSWELIRIRITSQLHYIISAELVRVL